MKKFREIIIPPSGKKNWGKGAYTLAFVYSNKGNLLVKGFLKEVQDFLKFLKQDDHRYFANITMWKRETYLIDKTLSKHATPQFLPLSSGAINFITEKIDSEHEDFIDYSYIKKSESRNYWTFSDKRVQISSPINAKKGESIFYDVDINGTEVQFSNKKYVIYFREKDSNFWNPKPIVMSFQFKRMPRKWIPEFDKMYQLLKNH